MKTTTTIARLHAWKRALRSGDYEQTTGRLGRSQEKDSAFSPSYCCLGVACIVALGNDKAQKTIVWKNGSTPEDVNEWFGVVLGGLVLGQDEYGVDIVAGTANDNLEWDFNQIADAIEKVAREMTE